MNEVTAFFCTSNKATLSKHREIQGEHCHWMQGRCNSWSLCFIVITWLTIKWHDYKNWWSQLPLQLGTLQEQDCLAFQLHLRTAGSQCKPLSRTGWASAAEHLAPDTSHIHLLYFMELQPGKGTETPCKEFKLALWQELWEMESNEMNPQEEVILDCKYYQCICLRIT